MDRFSDTEDFLFGCLEQSNGTKITVKLITHLRWWKPERLQWVSCQHPSPKTKGWNSPPKLMGFGVMFLLPKPWVTEEMAWWLWFIARLSQCSCTLREMSQGQKLVPWLPLFTLSCTSFESQNIGKESVICRFYMWNHVSCETDLRENSCLCRKTSPDGFNWQEQMFHKLCMVTKEGTQLWKRWCSWFALDPLAACFVPAVVTPLMASSLLFEVRANRIHRPQINYNESKPDWSQ